MCIRDRTGDREEARGGVDTLEKFIMVVDECQDPVSYTHLDVYKRQR